MTLPRRPAAVVFDMDGLLFDTEMLYQEAVLLAAAERVHEVAPGFFTQTVGLPWAECRALLLAHFGEAFAVDEFQEAWVRHFWVIAETRLSLKVGVLELLDTLDQFRLPRAIATSSSRRTVERHLTAHNLMTRFDAIVGHGDYERGKPAPDPFLKAAERLGVDPLSCLALEDSHNEAQDCEASFGPDFCIRQFIASSTPTVASDGVPVHSPRDGADHTTLADEATADLRGALNLRWSRNLG